MASVCGSSLSLMDAGVPIKRPVAGIAMGLIKEGDDYIVLTDIAGVEDHLGDMDFKVAGTEQGITALQMDIKITGVTFDILRDALAQAKEARTFILGKMAEVIDAPRERALAVRAAHPARSRSTRRRSACSSARAARRSAASPEEFESQIDVNDDGQVLIYSANGELGDALVERIRSMTKEVEVGDEFDGKVVKTTTFGAFVELAKGTDGLLHISNISPGERVDTVEDVLNKGDEIKVRVVEVDRERGRIGLRLADDPDVAGKSVEELAAVGSGGGNGGGGAPRPRRVADATAGAAATGAAAARRARAAAAGATAIAADAGAPAVDEHRLTELDSGVRVVTEAMPSVRSVALGFWIGTGSCAESDEQAGLSHLIEHMLFRGTERFGSLEIDQIFDAMGAELNAGTGKETTSVYSRVLDATSRARSTSWPTWSGGPRFEDARDRARGRARGDRDVRGRPAGQGLRRARRGGLRRAPARARDHRPRRGHRAHAARRASRAFHAARYVPGNVVIAAAGSVDHDALVELVERLRCRDRDGQPSRPARRRHGARARAVRFERKDTEQYHVCLGGPGIARDDERRFALRVLDNVLGGTSSSRLFQEVRERAASPTRVLVLQPVRRHRAGGLYLGTRPDNLGAALGSSPTSSSAARASRRPPRS